MRLTLGPGPNDGSVDAVSHAVLQALAIFAVGIAAGTINTVVGSGTLITFPTLLSFGYPPVLANVSNNVGLVPGTLSGIQGYRRELTGQRARIIRLGSASLLGGLVGAILLLVLPQSAFKAIVPVLIGLALVMVVLQPWLARLVAARPQAAAAGDSAAGDGTPDGSSAGPDALQLGGPVLWVLVFALGIYGGYFGAAQGILLLGLLGIAWNDDLQRINAFKNVLACIVNGVAAIVFIIATHIDWGAAGLIAAGSVIGGQVGARVGRRLPPWGLRAIIVCVGVAALVRLLA
ncbi:MAG TPA: sulfite exporter TauE/SafE family protein [Trebonia sp.]|nr:sulfite exporter TauE/SafE family protein [Trebonia sp.]